MAATPIPIDMSKAEPVDEWKADPDPARVQVVITDQGKRVVIRFEVNIIGVQRVGNNPMNGEPIYNIASQNVVKMLQWDRDLKTIPKSREGREPPASAYR